jgi:homoserine dehydrogenase
MSNIGLSHLLELTHHPSSSCDDMNICFLGFGNVGRALARLLLLKSAELRTNYAIEFRVTGIASRRLGWLYDQNGFDMNEVLAKDDALNAAARADNISDWLAAAQPHTVFETTSLNHETGQPAINYLRAVLESGAHAITANKGVFFGFDELSALAAARGKRFLFESTVADSAPIFSLFRETLPAVTLRGFSAVLSSTCSVIIETMEAGRSFAEGVKTAQELGVTETDPSHDVDGWDSTVKVCALARVLMNQPLKPTDVRREGIRGLTPVTLQAARVEGRPYKLVARAQRSSDGSLICSVRPEQLAATDPLANVRGTSLAVHFELDMMPGLTITSHRPNLQSTAYGLLADFVNAVKTDVT